MVQDETIPDDLSQELTLPQELVESNQELGPAENKKVIVAKAKSNSPFRREKPAKTEAAMLVAAVLPYVNYNMNEVARLLGATGQTPINMFRGVTKTLREDYKKILTRFIVAAEKHRSIQASATGGAKKNLRKLPKLQKKSFKSADAEIASQLVEEAIQFTGGKLKPLAKILKSTEQTVANLRRQVVKKPNQKYVLRLRKFIDKEKGRTSQVNVLKSKRDPGTGAPILEQPTVKSGLIVREIISVEKVTVGNNGELVLEGSNIIIRF